MLQLKVGTPPARHPTRIEWGTQAIARMATRQNGQYVTQGIGLLPDNPVAILAHDRQTVQYHRLPGTDNRPEPVAVEFLCDLKVDIHDTDVPAVLSKYDTHRR
jgi:hypothetical protein